MKHTNQTPIGLLAIAAGTLLGCAGFRTGMHDVTAAMVSAAAGPAPAREASGSSGSGAGVGRRTPTSTGAPAASPIASGAPAESPVAGPSQAPVQNEPASAQTTAGTLTAATVGDHDRRGAYLEYMGRHPSQRGRLGLDLSRRVRVPEFL